ncbi:MAG: OAM dimerization domain-containing protein [Pseudomonadota bacterium]
MIKVNLKKLKAYGDRLDDGIIQMSFTLPVPASPEAKEAARIYAGRMGLENIHVAAMEAMGKAFSYFVVYGNAQHTIDFTKIRVPKIEMSEMGFDELKEYMSGHLEKPIVVIGAATGSDAHTVGIDAIMNMKGYAGDWGLERYPLFKAVNLRSQLTNQQLIDKAIELKADAILVSQVVTQRDSHLKNLKELREIYRKDTRLPRETIIIIGGPRLDHAVAIKLGFDAGFGVGTKPSQVANFIVHEHVKRHGLAVPAPVQAPAADVPVSAAEVAVQTTGSAGTTPAPKKRRRRGRRGGRRHRKHPAPGAKEGT